jgi:hypothetical protein
MYYEGRKRLCIPAVGYTSWTKAFGLRDFACTNIDSLENRNRLIFILHTSISLFLFCDLPVSGVPSCNRRFMCVTDLSPRGEGTIQFSTMSG